VILAYAPESSVDLETSTVDRRDSARIAIRGARKPLNQLVGYCLVGAGGFGTSMLVPQMDKRRDVYQLKGIVSRDPVRGGNFARQRGVELLATDLDAVLSDDSIHLVVIATRHHEHAEQVVRALAAGKHVFVEKPLALTWAQLDRVRAAYEASDRILMVGFNRGFAPAALSVKEALATRKAPLLINYRLNGGFIAADSWIQGIEGGGRNIGEACHMYDFFASLANSPIASISARGIAPGATAYRTNDNFAATLSYEDGSVCNLVYTAAGPKTGLPKERIEVFCEGRAFLIDDFVRCIDYPSETILWQGTAADKGHYNELSALADALRDGEEGPIPVERIFETSAAALHIEDLLQGRDS
jgi:predicted dehydrogenase